MRLFRHRDFQLHTAPYQGSNRDMILKKSITAEYAGRRLDDALPCLFDALSKSEARRIIDRGGCAVNSTMLWRFTEILLATRRKLPWVFPQF